MKRTPEQLTRAELKARMPAQDWPRPVPTTMLVGSVALICLGVAAGLVVYVTKMRAESVLTDATVVSVEARFQRMTESGELRDDGTRRRREVTREVYVPTVRFHPSGGEPVEVALPDWSLQRSEVEVGHVLQVRYRRDAVTDVWRESSMVWFAPGVLLVLGTIALVATALLWRLWVVPSRRRRNRAVRG